MFVCYTNLKLQYVSPPTSTRMISQQDHSVMSDCSTSYTWTARWGKITILCLPAYCYLLIQKVYLEILFPGPCVILPDNLAFYRGLGLRAAGESDAVMNLAEWRTLSSPPSYKGHHTVFMWLCTKAAVVSVWQSVCFVVCMLVAVHVCLFLSFPADGQVMPRGRDASNSCCLPLHLNEDNARFGLLAALILLYLLCGAVVFSALEHPSELQAHQLWEEQLANFTEQNSVHLRSLQVLLRQYEEAFAAGIRVDKLRPRWDFSGAFYFVGTVISTIGE